MLPKNHPQKTENLQIVSVLQELHHRNITETQPKGGTAPAAPPFGRKMEKDEALHPGSPAQPMYPEKRNAKV